MPSQKIMPTRKIQFIANTTYSVSLPKEWIIKNNLEPKSEVRISETKEKDLLISNIRKKRDESTEIKLSLRDDEEDIEEIMMACYHRGFEKITIKSDSYITKKEKEILSKIANKMTGTEVSFEKDRMVIKNILDHKKLDLRQTLYRTSLFLQESLRSIIDGNPDLVEIKQNEKEINRLAHLAMKVCSLATRNTGLLTSSRIDDTGHLLYFLDIIKELENLGDHILLIAENAGDREDATKLRILEDLSHELKNTMEFIISNKRKRFRKMDKKKLKRMENHTRKIVDGACRMNMQEILRCVMRIEDSTLAESFLERNAELTK